eukprot:NODE_1257_length_1581_cov_167.590784_g1187_i0.p1 GENE.NODE_1257_length_1581_cov_167.590784_g1187_i0~~NODE_1257_length_1581_cov_167.590784_g1187_i0.p1  ORF type:complete len:501 (-),score=51.05 NODE_1257_length_1581_cov_167.590784_g1187_i0:78-1529(-)
MALSRMGPRRHYASPREEEFGYRTVARTPVHTSRYPPRSVLDDGFYGQEFAPGPVRRQGFGGIEYGPQNGPQYGAPRGYAPEPRRSRTPMARNRFEQDEFYGYGQQPMQRAGFRRPTVNGRSLIIGINYRGQGRRELYGCTNDALTMQKFLELQGWPQEQNHMRVLTEDAPRRRQPTYANILDSLEWLVEGARAGEPLFFGFSGHGFQIRDTSGDEADGMDEVLISMDGKKISDDTLFEILVKRLPRGTLLTCIIDCCHSGTVLDLPYNYQASRRGLNELGGLKRRSGSRGGQVVMFSGCRDDQESGDMDMRGAVAGGACTNAIISVLAEDGPSVTYLELLQGIQRKLKKRGLSQIPQLSSSQPLDLDAEFSIVPRGTPLIPLPTNNQLNPLLSILEREGRIDRSASRRRGPPGVRGRGWEDMLGDAMGGGGGGKDDSMADQFGDQIGDQIGNYLGGGTMNDMIGDQIGDQIGNTLEGYMGGM